VRSDLLAFLNFSHKGMVVLVGVTIGAFIGGVVVNLVPIGTAGRAVVIGSGVVAAVAVVASRPYGEDRGAWAMILGFALLAWLLTFALAGIVRARNRAEIHAATTASSRAGVGESRLRECPSVTPELGKRTLGV
jgi:hypothetical protein